MRTLNILNIYEIFSKFILFLKSCFHDLLYISNSKLIFFRHKKYIGNLVYLLYNLAVWCKKKFHLKWKTNIFETNFSIFCHRNYGCIVRIWSIHFWCNANFLPFNTHRKWIFFRQRNRHKNTNVLMSIWILHISMKIKLFKLIENFKLVWHGQNMIMLNHWIHCVQNYSSNDFEIPT